MKGARKHCKVSTLYFLLHQQVFKATFTPCQYECNVCQCGQEVHNLEININDKKIMFDPYGPMILVRLNNLQIYFLSELRYCKKTILVAGQGQKLCQPAFPFYSFLVILEVPRRFDAFG